MHLTAIPNASFNPEAILVFVIYKWMEFLRIMKAFCVVVLPSAVPSLSSVLTKVEFLSKNDNGKKHTMDKDIWRAEESTCDCCRNRWEDALFEIRMSVAFCRSAISTHRNYTFELHETTAYSMTAFDIRQHSKPKCKRRWRTFMRLSMATVKITMILC